MNNPPAALADTQPTSSPTHPHPTYGAQDQTPARSACRTGLCSTGLMKSFCPTCLILGLALLPFELLYRTIARLFRKSQEGK